MSLPFAYDQLRLELQKPQLQNFFAANSKRENSQLHESEILTEKDSKHHFEDSFHPIPLGKMNAISPIANSKHTINIVPIHTPVSSPENNNENGIEGLIMIRDTAEKSKSNHKKILSSGTPIAMGREVVIMNNHETSKSERVAAFPINNPLAAAPFFNLKTRQTAQRKKPQKVRNISMNLSVEHPRPHVSGLELSNFNLNTVPVRGSEEELEARIQAILENKRFDSEQIQELNCFFEEFANNFSELNSSKDTRTHREILRKIKLAYEIFFQNYMKNEQMQLKEAIAERNEALAENKKLKLELKEYGEEVRALKGNQSAKNIVSSLNGVSASQSKKIHHSPTSSGILTANKKHSIDQMDTPPITKNTVDTDKERETLRSIITTQQKTINAMKKKEMSLARILEACKKHGVDLESICSDEIKAVLENADNSNHQPSEEYDLPTINKNTAPLSKSLLRTKKNSMQKSDKADGDDGQNLHSEDQSSRSIQDSGMTALMKLFNHFHYLYLATESDLKDQSCDHFIVEDAFDIKQKQLDLNPMLKNKLKLDFTTLQNKNTNQPKIPGLKIQEVQVEAPVGFHEEFMARIDEFSLSWRQAAAKERKIP